MNVSFKINFFKSWSQYFLPICRTQRNPCTCTETDLGINPLSREKANSGAASCSKPSRKHPVGKAQPSPRKQKAAALKSQAEKLSFVNPSFKEVDFTSCFPGSVNWHWEKEPCRYSNIPACPWQEQGQAREWVVARRAGSFQSHFPGKAATGSAHDVTKALRSK